MKDWRSGTRFAFSALAAVVLAGCTAASGPTSPTGEAPHVEPRSAVQSEPAGGRSGEGTGADGGNTPSPKVDGSAAPTAVEQCGEDENVHGEGRLAEPRNCLWDAYQSGRPAAFRTTVYTIEGDPIAFNVEVHGPDRIAVLVDSDDRFGMVGEFAYVCTGMERTDDLAFTLTGCTGGDAEGNRYMMDEDGRIYIP